MEESVIFFDIDGTILTPDNTIPASASAAIRSARARGHRCVVNTGRPFSHIEPIVRELDFDGYICSCGQYLLLEGRLLRHETFSPTLCREIVAQVRAAGLDVIYEAEHGIWSDRTRPIPPKLRAELDRFARRGFDVDQSIDQDGFHFDKLCVWTTPGCRIEAFLAFIRPYCTVIDRGGGLFELVKSGCSKETGIRQIIEQLHLPLSRCYAIGDSSNDLPMLRCVPHSIAMGNAPAAVQRQVEYVTQPIEQDGLALALAHYGLI